MLNIPRTHLRILLFGVVLTWLSGCGYHLVGRGSFLPDYVQTIGVPVFQNKTSGFAVEQVVTDAVVRELRRRTKLEVVPRESNVDAVLAGTVTGLNVVPVGFSPDGRANRYQLMMTADVALLDARARKVIYENSAFVYHEDYDLDFGGTAPENASVFFDRQTEATDELAQNFAEAMVTAVLEGF